MNKVKKMFKQQLVLAFITPVFFTTTFAQGVVTIEHKTQRYIGEVSTIDRGKYLNGHFILNKNNDIHLNAFKTDLNLTSNYIGSRSFWNPMAQIKNGVIPTVRDKTDGIRVVQKGFVATGTHKQLFHDKTKDYSIEDVSELSVGAANYVALKYRDDWSPIPNYIEPFNEPMVHAVEQYPEGRQTPKVYKRDKISKIITKICEYHKDLGKAIHAIPELSSIKVMGFASAFPEFEGNNFRTWEDRYKKFIDIAGEDVDVFSLHLYDGSGLNNKGGRRSGSNVEAILDMVDAYSIIKLNEVKPIAITEYGRLVPDQPEWLNDNTTSNYDPVTNAQAVRSQIHMVMSFMEREDHLETAIPFNVNTRNTSSRFSKSSIWVNNGGTIEASQRMFFYKILKDLKGDRVRINSSNLDVQTQAFVEGNQLFVMLNNLNDSPQTVALNYVDLKDVESVDIKRLKLFSDKIPELTTTNETNSPSSLTLEYGETVVLKYNFNEPIIFNNKIDTKKYFATTYLQDITANTNTTFSFQGINKGLGFGNATLRIGLGRSHGKSLSPTVKVNGNDITYSGDVIKGYDQNNRKQFFGLLEIPVGLDVLNGGVNTVEVKFNDGGGQISSMALQLNTLEKEPADLSNPITDQNNKKAHYKNPITVGEKLLFNAFGEEAKIELYSVNGKLISEQSGNVLDSEGLNKGVYILSVKDKKSKLNSKLIIK